MSYHLDFQFEYLNVSLPTDADTSKSVCGDTKTKFVLTFPDPQSGWYGMEAADMWDLEMDFMLTNSVYNNTKLQLSYSVDGKFKGEVENIFKANG